MLEGFFGETAKSALIIGAIASRRDFRHSNPTSIEEMKALFKLFKLFTLVHFGLSAEKIQEIREKIKASGNFVSPKVELRQGIGAFAKENFP